SARGARRRHAPRADLVRRARRAPRLLPRRVRTHLGYFREEYGARRRWLDDATYGDLVALCQFLPGPASSQVGIAIGITRAGLSGGLGAWLGFTLPSAIALVAFAHGVRALDVADSGWLHGLKVAAVAVVALALWGMARALAPDRPRAPAAI